jgi:hypothetical protein
MISTEGTRSVHWLRQRRAEIAARLRELTIEERPLTRRLSRLDSTLKLAAYNDKANTNDKTREAAYKFSLTEDPDYLSTQQELDGIGDEKSKLQIEEDELRRELRIAEKDYEADRLGRRNAA